MNLGFDVPATPFVIRLAGPKDARQMLDIYGPVVRKTAISFELETPSYAFLGSCACFKTELWDTPTPPPSETGRAIGGP